MVPCFSSRAEPRFSPTCHGMAVHISKANSDKINQYLYMKYTCLLLGQIKILNVSYFHNSLSILPNRVFRLLTDASLVQLNFLLCFVPYVFLRSWHLTNCQDPTRCNGSSLLFYVFVRSAHTPVTVMFRGWVRSSPFFYLFYIFIHSTLYGATSLQLSSYYLTTARFQTDITDMLWVMCLSVWCHKVAEVQNI